MILMDNKKLIFYFILLSVVINMKLYKMEKESVNPFTGMPNNIAIIARS